MWDNGLRGLEFRVLSLGFRVHEGLRLRDYSLGYMMIHGLGIRAEEGSGFRDLGFRDLGFKRLGIGVGLRVPSF